MKKISTLLTLCAGNSPVTGEFPWQKPVTRTFDVSVDLRLIKRLSKHRYAGDLRPHCAHYDVTAMFLATVLYRRRLRGSNIVQNQPSHTYGQDCYGMVSHLNHSGPYSESHRKFNRIITRIFSMWPRSLLVNQMCTSGMWKAHEAMKDFILIRCTIT